MFSPEIITARKAAFETIKLAKQHIATSKADMLTSAELCLADAEHLYEQCDLEYAYKRALQSLSYSVGIGHADYLRCESFTR